MELRSRHHEGDGHIRLPRLQPKGDVRDLAKRVKTEEGREGGRRWLTCARHCERLMTTPVPVEGENGEQKVGAENHRRGGMWRLPTSPEAEEEGAAAGAVFASGSLPFKAFD
jgi:hypothetical protein